MDGVIDHESDDSSLYVEVDPTGRYGRYNEILGKGASKIVYRGFDEYEGIEIAWNQVRLTDFLQRPEDLERLYSEIHLLKTLKHKNIMKFYTSWVDTGKRNINFVTEMFTSGTLRQYRLKHKKVNIRAVKHWCRQILEGLLYLHSHEPPVIHRDLKCDNIFINGNQGEVKIGDLGLAAILRKSHAARCVGTPEFMAPEVYAEEYNELVDIYSFGMCVLEMVTFEYPYSECTHPAQIYKKVTSGKKPEALYRVNDPEVRVFVEKCLASVSERLSARELLQDPFLQTDDIRNEMRVTGNENDIDKADQVLQLPDQNEYERQSSSNLIGDCWDYTGYEPDHEYEYQELAVSGLELFTSLEDDDLANTDITINGKRKEDGEIFLRLRIKDKEGRIRNIYFPFDTETDTALSVAAEMVAELEIGEQDVTRIADMIDGEIAFLVPDWKREVVVGQASESTNENPKETQTDPLESSLGQGVSESDENSDITQTKNLQSCLGQGVGESDEKSNTKRIQTNTGESCLELRGSDVCSPTPSSPHNAHGQRASLADYLKLEDRGSLSNRIRRCSSHGSSIRGRFEEITYSLEANDNNYGMEPSGMQYKDKLVHHQRRPSLRFHGITEFNFEEASEKDECVSNVDDKQQKAYETAAPTPCNSPASSVVDETEYESEILKEQRWLKAKHQLQLRELTEQNLTAKLKPPILPAKNHYNEMKRGKKPSLLSKEGRLDANDLKNALRKHFASNFPSNFGKGSSSAPKSQKRQSGSCSPDHMVTVQSFYTTTMIPHSLQRTTSLPVDAVDC